MPESKKLIIILGPHRSGTSLYTAALESLGAELCLPAHYINEENRKGFFEHPDIVDFNDRLLAHLGGAWDNPCFDGPNATKTADLKDWRLAAARLCNSIYGGKRVVAIKDPRLCQLLDFWMEVFLECGFVRENIYIIHVLREPVEVALSQQKRARDNPAFYEIGEQLVEGTALWLSLSAQAFTQTKNLQNVCVDYSRLLSEPVVVLKQLAAFSGLNADPASVSQFCENFVDPSLHRSVADAAATAVVADEFPQALEFRNVLETLGAEGSAPAETIAKALAVYARPDTQWVIAQALSPAISRLSERCRRDSLEVERQVDVIGDLEQQVSEHASMIPPLRTHIEALEAGNVVHEEVEGSLREELETQRGEMNKLGEGLRELEYTVGEMQASTSWKLTRPIRRLGAFRKRLKLQIQKDSAKFRLKSIHRYQRMSVRHPRFAWLSRVALRPFFRVVKNLATEEHRQHTRSSAGGIRRSMVYQQVEPAGEYRPFVTIIVPNFNHASYLALRLDSIYSQTYQSFEVILLDDASTDGSSEVLARYRDLHPHKTKLLLNEENSGGVFHQWEKGLHLATGDIVWIAESDDWCSENFLQTLVPFFENEAIALAYSKTVFMDASGEEPQWSIGEYLYDIDPDRWEDTFVEPANTIVAEAFALKNIVPNVSSAIFRNPGSLEILRDPQWKEMRICGDWIFYLHILRGGVMAYSPKACNYYRIHGDNTSVKSYSEDKYYEEHELVAKAVRQYYRVDTEVFLQQRENLVAHWRETRSDFSEEAFEACYSPARIEAVSEAVAPNLLMASYGFCSGGGETFPVELANLMKAEGYNVTYLDCAQEPRNEGVRKNLRSDIPVVSDFKQLEVIVEEFGIDVIHSHHAWVDSTILDLLPENVACKTIVTLHGMYETINYVDLKFILPRLVKRSARLVYVAEKNLSALQEHKLACDDKLVRIENALVAADFEPVQRIDLGIPAEAFVLTLVSRAMKEKGWQEAVEVVTRAREISGSDIHLILVGDGLEYDRMRELPLPEFIHLEGFQRNVRGYFSIADAGFLPSKFRGESSPLVVIECLQAGRPFLASALGDIPYMLSGSQGKAGILIELDGAEIDISAWAAAIDGLASDRKSCDLLRDKVVAAAEKFDSALMARKHDEVYRAALMESGS